MISKWSNKFEPWKLISYLIRFMDQNRQMLGADPVLFSLVLEKQQRDGLVTLITI